MRRTIRIATLMVQVVFLAVSPVSTALAASPVHLRFASHVIGGSGYTQVALIAQQLRPHLPSGSTIDVLPYSGGIGNVILIENAKAELGIGNTTSDRWAVDGKITFDKKYGKLRHIATTDLFYIVVYSTEKSGIISLEDALKMKKPIRWCALEKGAIGEIATRLVLEGYGASPEKLKEWGGSFINTGWVNIAPIMKDGRADIASHGVGIGHPSMTEIALSVPGRFLELSESVRDLLAKDYGFDKLVMPVNSFKNQSQPIRTVGYYFTITASAQLPEDIAYQLAKTLAEERQELIKGYKSFEVIPIEASCQPGKYGAPIHPGAERYYRERGWIK